MRSISRYQIRLASLAVSPASRATRLRHALTDSPGCPGNARALTRPCSSSATASAVTILCPGEIF